MIAIQFGGAQAAIDNTIFGTKPVKVGHIVPQRAEVVNTIDSKSTADLVRQGQRVGVLPTGSSASVSSVTPSSTADTEVTNQYIGRSITGENQRTGISNGDGVVRERRDPITDRPGGALIPSEEPIGTSRARTTDQYRTTNPGGTAQEKYHAADPGSATAAGMQVQMRHPQANAAPANELQNAFGFTGEAAASTVWTQADVDQQRERRT